MRQDPRLLASAATGADISGAGAGSPYPVYAAWAVAYRGSSGMTLEFQSVGSSAGIRSIKERAVDFGASDVALHPDDLAKGKLVNFPTLVSGVVPFVNVPAVRPGDLRLTGELLASIFAGRIARWNGRPLNWMPASR
jgi:phosphate transport system substrate-binding protein